MRDLKANPDTWLQVVHILQNTRSMHTKYFALQVSLLIQHPNKVCLESRPLLGKTSYGFHFQVLEGVIKYRWNALPVDQRDGMKNYISEVIVQVLYLRGISLVLG